VVLYTILTVVDVGKRLENWLSKASTNSTRKLWKSRWLKFAKWVITESNPLTQQPYMDCGVDEVDDHIRADFESMPSHIFLDKYRDILVKYVASVSDKKSNTAASLVSSVRSFFTNETMSIKLPSGKVPQREMASNEHRFTLDEFRRLWMVADTEGKARLSAAVSLGWGIGDFIDLKVQFIRNVLKRVDEDGFVSFDYRRKKTRARVRGILTPNAIQDLKNYLSRIPENQVYIWSTRTRESFSYWIKKLCEEADITEDGTIRFHLIRKYVYDTVSSTCGSSEAKLLTGKRIPLSDATYLHGLEDRLLERYKKFAYPFLRLNGTVQSQETKIEKLTREVEDLKMVAETWEREAIDMKREIKEIREMRRESDNVMDKLFEDDEFKVLLRKKLKELKP
jgi:hypothetical protein